MFQSITFCLASFSISCECVCVCYIETQKKMKIPMFIVVIVLSFCVNCSTIAFFYTLTRMRMSKPKNVLREDEENRTDFVVESLHEEREAAVGMVKAGLTKLTPEIAAQPKSVVKKAMDRISVWGGSLHDAHSNGENIRAILHWLNFNSQSKHNPRSSFIRTKMAMQSEQSKINSWKFCTKKRRRCMHWNWMVK